MIRHILTSLRSLLAFSVILGLLYPLVIFGVGRFMPNQADGSLLRVNGQVVGSSLLGQDFQGDQWFHARPSASNYSGENSGGTNWGPTEPEALTQWNKRAQELEAENPRWEGLLPPDALTASASGLDPHISPEYAQLQARRVAESRGMNLAEVEKLIAEHTQGRFLGISQPRVNVTTLNAALATIEQH